VSWSYGMVFVVKVSLILFLTFSPKRIGSHARNFSFQKGWFESSLSMTRVRKVFLYHWKSLSFLHLRLERSSTFLSFKCEGSPTKCKEIVRIRVDTASWIVFPDGLRMGVWSSYVWKEFRICRWSYLWIFWKQKNSTKWRNNYWRLYKKHWWLENFKIFLNTDLSKI